MRRGTFGGHATQTSLIERMGRQIAGFNERPLTLDDFYRECDRRGITAEEVRLRQLHGFALYDGGTPGIVLNSLLGAPDRTVAAFHELTHVLDQVPFPHVCMSRPDNWNRSKQERQAQAVGLVAVIPRRLLIDLTLDEIAAEYGYPRRLVAERMQLWLDQRI
jgi:Zn-dependent peptidase ImmA (M78 family)